MLGSTRVAILFTIWACYITESLPMASLPVPFCQKYCAAVRTSPPSAICAVFSERVQLRFCYQGAETGKLVGCAHCCSSTVFDWQLESALLLRSRLASCRNSNSKYQQACDTGFNSVVAEIIKALEVEFRRHIAGEGGTAPKAQLPTAATADTLEAAQRAVGSHKQGQQEPIQKDEGGTQSVGLMAIHTASNQIELQPDDARHMLISESLIKQTVITAHAEEISESSATIMVNENAQPAIQSSIPSMNTSSPGSNSLLGKNSLGSAPSPIIVSESQTPDAATTDKTGSEMAQTVYPGNATRKAQNSEDHAAARRLLLTVTSKTKRTLFDAATELNDRESSLTRDTSGQRGEGSDMGDGSEKSPLERVKGPASANDNKVRRGLADIPSGASSLVIQSKPVLTERTIGSDLAVSSDQLLVPSPGARSQADDNGSLSTLPNDRNAKVSSVGENNLAASPKDQEVNVNTAKSLTATGDNFQGPDKQGRSGLVPPRRGKKRVILISLHSPAGLDVQYSYHEGELVEDFATTVCAAQGFSEVHEECLNLVKIRVEGAITGGYWEIASTDKSGPAIFLPLTVEGRRFTLVSQAGDAVRGTIERLCSHLYVDSMVDQGTCLRLQYHQTLPLLENHFGALEGGRIMDHSS